MLWIYIMVYSRHGMCRSDVVLGRYENKWYWVCVNMHLASGVKSALHHELAE